VTERYVEVTLKVLVKTKEGETRDDVVNNFWEIVDEDHRSLEIDIAEVKDV